MKKIAIVACISFLFALISSCTKDEVTSPDNNRVVQPPSPTAKEVKIVSSWFSLSLDSIMDRSNACLIGRHEFETNEPYDRANHVELAYVNIPGQRIAQYKKLPFKYVSPDPGYNKICSLNPSMDQTGFILTISNLSDPNAFPDATSFDGFKYRYIVISKSLYNSFTIDWNDYTAVAQALNI